MIFQPTNRSRGTSKLCYLLDNETSEMLRGITPKKLSLTFGEKSVDFYEYKRGYTDPEWYFKSSCGSTVGIGFRWGVPRFRGDSHNKDVARRFIKYAHGMINISLSTASKSAKARAIAQLCEA